MPNDPNPIALAEAQARSTGHALRKLNDSNPTKHGLGPELIAQVYDADPKGPQDSRIMLSKMLNRRNYQCCDSSNCTESQGNVDPEDIYLLSSTSQAYSWLIKLLCDAEDVVLMPKPGYPLIESIARLECVNAISYPLRYDGSWTIDIAAIREMMIKDVGGRIKALVLINPNNPTASYVREEERKAVVELCKQHGVAIIADEVFFDYALTDREQASPRRRFAGERQVLTFALDGFSKMLAAPHAKVGWIQLSGPESDVREAQIRLDAIADDYLPMSALITCHMSQMLALIDSQLALVRQRIVDNYALLRQLLAEDRFGLVDVLRAEGGWNVLLRVPAVIDEDDLVLALIKHHKLTAQPGYFFDMASNGFLALSLLPEHAEFASNVRDVLSEVHSQLSIES